MMEEKQQLIQKIPLVAQFGGANTVHCFLRVLMVAEIVARYISTYTVPVGKRHYNLKQLVYPLAFEDGMMDGIMNRYSAKEGQHRQQSHNR